ncbi:MAG: hypothetical protein KAJ24_04595, partial [Candidatus Aenigmarchaeota archaeon]|nr:hypothetical protein [Candidatus Aenigmarchaeota archaeon]
AAYTTVKEKIDVFEKRLSALKTAGKDVYDIEVELKMARDKMSQGLFKMAETYVQSIETRIKGMGG